MKFLAACFLGVALIFRAAPICASPMAADAVVLMAECDDTTSHHGDERGQKGESAARACHACVWPPIASAVFYHPMPLVAVLHVDAVTPVTGGLIEPPTPPPRAASATIIQQFNGVTS